MAKTKIFVILGVAVLVAAFFLLDLSQYLSLETLKRQQASIEAYYHENPWQAIAIYLLVYIVVAALAVPGALWVTIAGGAIFGVLVGTIVVSFASSIGATIAFLVSRFLLRDWVQERFARNLQAVNAGMRRDGAFYLFTMRLVPIFPFWMVNLVMGLTPMPTRTFYLVSQAGMLAATVIYVNAGTQLAKLESLGQILSPGLIASLTLLGVFPLLAKRSIAYLKARAVYQPYRRPRRFDRDVVVIGAGSAGLVAAYISAAVRAKVTLIEKLKMGGDCLNTGCVPSKALLRSAKLLAGIKRARELGMTSANVEFDFANVMERVQRVIRTVAPHDSVERYTRLGVECISGEARIRGPFEVAVNGRTLTTRNIIIAAGAAPLVPPIPGIDKIDYWTSDTVWDIRELPNRLLVLGGGPIGCELAQAFARFGSRVTQVEMLPRLLPREDPEISEMLQQRFIDEGIELRLAHRAKEFRSEGAVRTLICEHDGREVRVEFDHVLLALGRRANTQGYGLEELGVPLTASGEIDVNEYLQTIYPNIYACGDVAGPYQFTHTASHQAWYAAVNALFGSFKRFKADYSVIPWATFTDPEVARVGLNEIEARERRVPYEITRYRLDDLDRAIADDTAFGVVKVLTAPGKDRILGAAIVGEHASDLIVEHVAAMRNKFGLNRILGTIHIYPTLAEANKYVAGEWKRAHAPRRLLSWLERYHRWRRGQPREGVPQPPRSANVR